MTNHEQEPKVLILAKQVAEALAEVLSNVTMAKKPRDILDQQYARMLEVVDQLRLIHEEYVPLTVARNDHPLTTARMEWQALAPGLISSNDAVVERLIQTSPTLQTLHRAGITLKSFYRFRAEEDKLANDLGNSFQQWHSVWDRFKIAVQTRCSYFSLTDLPVGEHEGLNGLFLALKRHGVIERFAYEKRVFAKEKKDNTWEEINTRQLHTLTQRLPKHPRRVTFSIASRELLAVVSGNWLTAYAGSILSDHLDRNEFDFEIYTQVAYHAPEDVLRVRGDFDLLARASEKILAIECKSGRLRASAEHGEQRNDFQELIDKASGLRRVFALVGGEQDVLTFWLVYNPFLNTPEDVDSKLAGSDIVALTPDRLRGRVIEFFRSR